MRLSTICPFVLPLVFTVANAATILTLDSSTITITPGDTVQVTGALLNPDATTLFINGVSYDPGSIDLTLDPTDFLLNGPTSLTPGSSYSGVLFALTASPTYQGSALGWFSVLGGADSFILDPATTANFTVEAGATSVPEPSTPFLTIGAAIALAIARRTRWRSARPVR